MYSWSVLGALRPEESVASSGTGVTSVCRYRDLNFAPLKEQVLLTTEPSIQAPKILGFLKNYLNILCFVCFVLLFVIYSFVSNLNSP